MARGKTLDGMLFFIGCRTLVARTCRKCDELKDAEHFQQDGQGHWKPWCRLCVSRSSATVAKRINEASQIVAIRAREPWMFSEIVKLEDMTRLGWPSRRIASELGRSVTAVNVARSRFLNARTEEE